MLLSVPEEVIIGTFTKRHERTTNNLRTTTDLTKFLEMLCYAAWAWPYEQKISKKVVSQKEVELTPYIPGKNLQSFRHAVAKHWSFQKGQEYVQSHSPCARRVQSWEWSKISFEPDGRFINKMFLFNFIMSTFSNLFLDISFSDEPRLVSVLWRFLLSDDLVLQLILRGGHLISAEEYSYIKGLPFLRLVPPLHFFLLTEGSSTKAIARRNASSFWSIPCDHYSRETKAW